MKGYLERQDAFADGSYSDDVNSKTAESHKLNFITTNFTGRKLDEIYANFQFTEDGRYLLKCVNGYTPDECRYDPGNERSVAYFKTET